MQDLMKTHTTPEKKWLKERDELFKLAVYLFSPSRAITWVPSSDTNPYQITKYQLSGAETRSELCSSQTQIWYKHFKKRSLPAIMKQTTQPAASQSREKQEARTQQTAVH